MTRYLLLLVFAGCIGMYVKAQVVYVTPTGLGTQTGNSWANAAPGNQLQNKIGTATPGTQILVAGGTYRTTTGTVRDSSFVIRQGGVRLSGGYNAATGVRDIAANQTVLSGDIGILNSTSDNSYHVLVIAGINSPDSIVVDGFTIEYGNANGGATSFNYNGQNIWRNEGGGMMQWGNGASGRFSVRNCIFRMNNATNGAGLAKVLSNASSSVAGCIFSGNAAQQAAGGIYNYGSPFNVAQCTFFANSAVNGGGIYNYSSPFTIAQCTFSGNTASNGGGGIFNSNSTGEIRSATFSSNSVSTGSGGGVCNVTSNVQIIGCGFTNNAAANLGGGGVYNTNSSVKLSGNTFSNNAGIWGGAVLSQTSSVSVLNSVFNKNMASSSGGAIFQQNGAASAINITCSGNQSPAGTSIVADGAVTINVSNSVFGNNSIIPSTVSHFSIVNGAGININYSLIPGGYAGTGNQNSAPLFVDPYDAPGPDGILGTGDDGLRLLYGSPAINKGRNDSLPSGITNDITGNVRIQEAVIDMGAYEGGTCPSSSTLYVDAAIAPSGSGTSWTSAFKDLREALAVAQRCTNITTILVARGTHSPTKDNNRDSAFTIIRGGLKIYGGYPTGGGVRNVSVNPTILSGDIGAGNDVTDNSYHVMVIAGLSGAADSVVVDGFRITGGNANGSAVVYYGNTETFQGNAGGIYLKRNANGNRIALRNLTVAQNYAGLVGGGIDVFDSNPLITGCSINGNASNYDGGGMFIESGSKPLIRNCDFTSNAATSFGGAIRSSGTSAEITNCNFTTNTANNGGAIRNDGGASPPFSNCTFSANTAIVGGAVSNDRCLSVFTDCIFTGNTATSGGGAILNYTSSGITLTRCRLTQNSSTDGGAVHNNGSSPIIISTIFSKNTATSGGAIINYSSSPKISNSVFTENASAFGGGALLNSMSTSSLINCSLVNNTASSPTLGYGGAICNINASTQYISNSIVWGNTGNTPGIYGGSPTVTYSIIQGGYAGAGNLDAAPLFTDESDVDGADNILGTADDGLRLLAGSAAINAGRNDSLSSFITTDITNATRIQNAVIDLGAYEGGLCPGSNTLYVDSSRTTAGKGDSWSSAFKELRDAVSIARSCTNITSILVAKGTYKPTSDNNRDSAFAILRGGLKIYGGYPTGGGARNVNSNPTILSGDIGTPNSNADNTYHIAVIAGLTAASDSAVIDGFTFTKASATGSGFKAYNGWYVLRNEGGGIYLYGNNGAAGKVMVRDCKFISNAATDWGGALYNKQSSPTVQNCVFTLNTAINAAGIFNYDGSSPRIVNSVFTGNIANIDGGAIHNRLGSSPSIINCTLAANSAAAAGAGIYNNGSSPVITNCIVWNNTGNYNSIYNDNSSPNVTTTIVQGGHTGTGNLNTAPLFINAGDPDGADNIFGTADDGLNLLTGSAAVNSGSDAAATGFSADITGGARIQNGTIDRGAYEGGACVSYAALYVDSSVAVSGKGDSWSSPFKEFSEAISVARQCTNVTSIRVAKGTYLPTSVAASRDSVFTIFRGGLKLFGGYPTGGIGFRDFIANPTILSGDIGNIGDSTDNSYHVIVIGGLPVDADSVVLDGFTITKGNASANSLSTINGMTVNNTLGGGILAGTGVTAKTVIRNCVIAKNTASNGGGIRIQPGASPTLTNCIFSFNNAAAGGGISTDSCTSSITGCSFNGNYSSGRGGAILNWLNSPITLTNCSFNANNAANGGGLFNNSSTATLSGCSFVSNTGTTYGGGISNYSALPVLNNCTFISNSAYRGGGIYNYYSSPVISNCEFTSNTGGGGSGMFNDNSSPAITNCRFTSNTATEYAAALENIAYSAPVVKNCTFSLNTSVSGGAVLNQTSSAVYNGCVFLSNSASWGGAMYNIASASPSVINCLFINNKALVGAGGAMNNGNANASVKNSTFTANNSVTGGSSIFNQTGGIATVVNSICWGNTGPNPGVFNNGGSVVVTYSLIEGTGIYPGAGNINSDALFVNPSDPDGADNIYGTADDGLQLQDCSPAINTGNKDSLPPSVTTDLITAPRIFAGDVDMGVYEKQTVNYTQSTWNGVNTNWNDKANWCGGFIPTITTNVTIPGSRSFYPVITTGITAFVRNITIDPGANVKVDNGATLNSTSSVLNSGSLTINGTMKFTGTGVQTFPGTGIIADVQDFEVDCGIGGSVWINKPFGITGELSLSAGMLNLNVANITLRSTASGTASIGQIKSGASIQYNNGRFIIERFINVGTISATVHGKSWQFLSTAVQGSATDATAPTIRNSWQENGATASTGYGTWVTDPSYTATNGLDVLSAITSIKNYNASTSNWQSLLGTAGTNIPLSNKKGYMLFVRGDRSINSAAVVATTPTNMRSRGKVYDRVTLPPATTITTGNTFESVGNPYASAIDFAVLRSNSTNIDNVFYAWDPSLGGSYGVGGYQTISGVTGYRATPGSGKIYNIPNKDYRAIQSGQAFFVHSAAAGNANVPFNETVKVTGSFLAHRDDTNPSNVVIAMLSTTLVTSTGNTADGNRVVFDAAYSNVVDANDAIKIFNSGENFGLLREAKSLAVEARQPLKSLDTIFYNITNLQPQVYQLMFVPESINFAGLEAMLIDKYLDVTTPVSLTDTTFISFTISDAASKVADRFMLVFKAANGPVPVTFTNISAYKNEKSIDVKWNVENELNIRSYEVEKSLDGISFKRFGSAAPRNNNGGGSESYTLTDLHPATGTNFYRVKSLDLDGSMQYTRVVKVVMGEAQGGIKIYPNPVVNNNMQLWFNDMPAGTYTVQLFNNAGQLIEQRQLQHAASEIYETVKTRSSVSFGTYQVVITGPNNTRFSQPVFF